MIFILFAAIPSASGALDYKTFPGGNATVITSPDGVFIYSLGSRTIRNIVLDESRVRDGLLDAIQDNTTLWFLTAHGVYQFDANTETVTKIPFINADVPAGKLAVDNDYLWLLGRDSLWRFDKLGREWLGYGIRGKLPGDTLPLGAYGTGDKVAAVFSGGAYIFSVADEQWRFNLSTIGAIPADSRFFPGKDPLTFVSGKRILRYTMSTQSWDKTEAVSPILDIAVSDQGLNYLLSDGLYALNITTLGARRIDVLAFSGAISFVKTSGAAFAIATPKNIIQFDSATNTTSFLVYPEHAQNISPEKMVEGNGLLAIDPRTFYMYDPVNSAWLTLPREKTEGLQKRLTWDDNGLVARHARGYSSTLKGSVTELPSLSHTGWTTDITPGDSAHHNKITYKVDSLGDTIGRSYYNYDTTNLYLLKAPRPVVNLTLHNSFPDDRYLDLFFDNSSKIKLPNKGLLYRGNQTDIVQSGAVGHTDFVVPQSLTMPKVTLDGGGMVLETPQKLADRDRKIGRLTAGGGAMMTRTINQVLPYRVDGRYALSAFSGDQAGRDTLAIVPGSLTVRLDGEMVDSTLYTFVTFTGALIFKPQVPIDPTSMIAVTYQVQTIPAAGLGRVEFPSVNRFGAMAYADALASPTDWLSARLTYVQLAADSLHKLLGASVPLEFRGAKYLLKAEPEFTYDAATGAKAGALSVQSRLGNKTSLVFSGITADSNFATTDNLDKGYGALRQSLDGRFNYDCMAQVPLAYHRRDIRAYSGDFEDLQEVTAGAHFPGLPFLDAGLSRNRND
ncbi:MAG: hypothetical protein PHC61_15635, partial [Chitinivibrionales bacterium]|nr:hypothetical protein [Chitinivibrionales bacterium]